MIRWDSLGSIGIHWDPLGSAGIRWNPLGSAGVRSDPLGSAGIRWGLLGSAGIRWVRFPWIPSDSLCLPFSINLLSVWLHFGSILVHFTSILPSFQMHFGYILAPFASPEGSRGQGHEMCTKCVESGPQASHLGGIFDQKSIKKTVKVVLNFSIDFSSILNVKLKPKSI